MTQEQLAYIVDRAPRTIMYNENDGQHPSLNTFYQMVTMFDISVDQYFYPSKNKGSECRKRMLYCPSFLLFPSKKTIPDKLAPPFFRPSTDCLSSISSCTKGACSVKQYAQYVFSCRIQK